MKATIAPSAPGRARSSINRTPRQRRVDVFHPQSDVVQAGAALVEILRDRRIRRRRFQHLERRVAGVQERRSHLLRRNLLGDLDVQAEHVPEERKRRLQIAHGDPDMIENGFHQDLRALVRISEAAV
jgi:hypothetical protein